MIWFTCTVCLHERYIEDRLNILISNYRSVSPSLLVHTASYFMRVVNIITSSCRIFIGKGGKFKAC